MDDAQPTATDRPYLTVVIVRDAEKDPRLLDYCLAALALNDLSDTQVIILDQSIGQAAPSAVFPFEVQTCGCPTVGHVRLWDLCRCMRAVMPKVRGKYLMLWHQEFIPEPTYLEKSIAWLREHTPDVALSNLMRLGSVADIDKRVTSSSKPESTKLKRAISTGDRARIEAAMAKVKCLPWIYRRTPHPGQWAEDVYFARSDWLRELRFFEHADRLIWQDVYDLMGEACRVTGVSSPRVPVGRLYHLWHPKAYPQYCEDVRQWFAANPDPWEGTYYADESYSRLIEKYLADPLAEHLNPIVRFRRGPKGSVARWLAKFVPHWQALHPDTGLELAGTDIPIGARTGYLLAVDNDRWRRAKAYWKKIECAVRETGLPVLVRVPGKGGAKPTGVYNCVITHANAPVLAAELGVA